MIDRTGMTIEVYLKQAGIKSRGSSGSQTPKPLEEASPSSFDALLQAARSTAKPDTTNSHQKMTIADYLRACKDQTKISTSFNPAPISGNSPDAMAGSSGTTSDCRTTHQRQPSLNESQPEVVSSHGDRSGDTHIRPDIRQSIGNAAKKYAISEKLIQSVIQAESNYRPDAVSPAGAQGLMQLMPATARELGVSDPFDVDQNIDAGAQYLKKMLDRFHGDIKLALAAYNAGPATVERYNGNVPYQETQTYIQRVLSTMTALKQTIG